jgi:hypothetical protein
MDFKSFENTSGFEPIENQDLVQVVGGGAKPSVGPIINEGGAGIGVTIPLK